MFIEVAIMLGALIAVIAIVVSMVISNIREKKYRELEAEALRSIGFTSWGVVSRYDSYVYVKSRQALERYDEVKFFREDRKKSSEAYKVLERKKEVEDILKEFLKNNILLILQ